VRLLTTIAQHNSILGRLSTDTSAPDFLIRARKNHI